MDKQQKTKTGQLCLCSLMLCRYTPESGDVVVGRVTEVCPPSIDLSSQRCSFQFLFTVELPWRLSARFSLDQTVETIRMQVAPKRWKLDINSRQDATLMLSAVNLPGGIQVCVDLHRKCLQKRSNPSNPQHDLLGTNRRHLKFHDSSVTADISRKDLVQRATDGMQELFSRICWVPC